MSRIKDSPDVNQVDLKRMRSLDPSLTEGDCAPVGSNMLFLGHTDRSQTSLAHDQKINMQVKAIFLSSALSIVTDNGVFRDHS